MIVRVMAAATEFDVSRFGRRKINRLANTNASERGIGRWAVNRAALGRIAYAGWLMLGSASAWAADAVNLPSMGSAERLKSLEDRVGRLEGAPAQASISAFNPAIGMSLDTFYSDVDGDHGFNFRSAELNLEAPVDPFLKAWAVINASSDEVEVEEAAMETTALAGNVRLTAGRLFASFGRWGHFHDHELAVVERPAALDQFLDGETKADGVEVSYLVPTSLYLNAILGAYNKIGAENKRLDTSLHGLGELTYLGRLSTSLEMGDNHSIELGVSTTYTPRRVVQDATATVITRDDTWRLLGGIDLVYRYQPVRGGLYRGFVWGTELLYNNEQRFDDTLLPTERVRAVAGYSYLELKAGRHWRPGFWVDMTQNQDDTDQQQRTYTGYLTYTISEFNRLRAEVSHVDYRSSGTPDSDRVALQWTVVFGHHLHGFRDR